MYDAPMKHIIALGFALSLTLSGCGGGSTTDTPDGNTGGSIEQTNARLTTAVRDQLAVLESLAGTSVIDNSNYSSTNFEVKLMILREDSGTLFTWEISCEYQLTTEKYTRISYNLTNEFSTEAQTGNTYCPESE